MVASWIFAPDPISNKIKLMSLTSSRSWGMCLLKWWGITVAGSWGCKKKWWDKTEPLKLQLGHQENFPTSALTSWGKFQKIYLFSVHWKLITHLATEVGVEKTEFWNSSSYLLLLSWKRVIILKLISTKNKTNKQNTHTHTHTIL